MINQKLQRKQLFSMIFMYLIAPQIWGLWMVLKLRLISFKEYLHLATSPLTLVIILVFFISNRGYYKKKTYKFILNNIIDPEKRLKAVPIFHMISIILFGTVATFLAMLTLYYPQLGFIVKEPAVSIKAVIVGSIAGTSLIFIFFFLFTSMLIKSFEIIVKQHRIKLTYSLFHKYLPWNLTLVVIGIFLMIFSTMEALFISKSEMETSLLIKQLNFNILTLILPIAIGVFVFVRQIKSISHSLNL